MDERVLRVGERKSISVICSRIRERPGQDEQSS